MTPTDVPATRPQPVVIGDALRVGAGQPLLFLGGPCSIEGLDPSLRHAETIRDVCARTGVSFVFKSSFDKANRTSLDAPRGVGLDEGLRVLEEVRRQVGVPVVTDVHESAQVSAVSQVVDVLQIPAFLCRQTDLLLAAGESGKAVNVKKGQFLAPWDMRPVVEKVASTGNRNLLVTERGVSFGYNNLVADMRSLPALAELGYPVVFDAGHSVQLPGGKGTSSGGQRELIRPLARAAVAVGVDAVFLEVHENPERAWSDGASSYRLEELEELLRELVRIDEAVKGK